VHASVRMYLWDGKIKIYEVPSTPHTEVAGEIIAIMAHGTDRIFDTVLMQT
jgi:hypothetical protein